MTEKLLTEILNELKKLNAHFEKDVPLKIDLHDTLKVSATPVTDFIPATIEDLRKIFAHVSSLGKKDDLIKILKAYGVEKLPQLEPGKYDEVYEKAEKLTEV
jgi:DNA-directed RNA polymerase subunit F